jgi:hypothetical protein
MKIRALKSFLPEVWKKKIGYYMVELKRILTILQNPTIVVRLRVNEKVRIQPITQLPVTSSEKDPAKNLKEIFIFMVKTVRICNQAPNLWLTFQNTTLKSLPPTAIILRRLLRTN